jgi:hypothetical protein
MKTQIIHLDSHDDLISIRDRMAWAKTPRILLVWPKRGRVGVRPLDLTLLRRHAESLGAEMGIVTRDDEICAAARELGISLFSTAVTAQKKQWLERGPVHIARRFPRRNLRIVRQKLPGADLLPISGSPAFRVLVFALGVLAVLVVMLVFIPSADVRITLPEQTQSLDISVSAAPGIDKVQISGLVPARTLTLIVDGKASALSTGKATLPDQTATGECLLTNLTDKVVSVPAGTVLLASTNPSVSFVTVKQVDVPEKKAKKSASVPVHALKAGSNGNLPAGAINSFEGQLGLSLVVLNPAPTSGGNDSNVDVATEQDRDSLKKRLLADLEQDARDQFPAQITVGDVLFPSTLTRLNVAEETFSPPAGQAGTKLSLTMRAEYSIAYATSTDLQELAGRVLNASLSAGFAPVPGPVNLQEISPLVERQGTIRWQMRAERRVRPYLDSGQVIFIVLGKTAGRAGSLLTETYGLVQSPEIRIRPLWWPWLPFIPVRIAVTS